MSGNHDHFPEDSLKDLNNPDHWWHEHTGEYTWMHTHVTDPENKIHDHAKSLQTNIEKYLDEIISHEKEGIWKELNYERSKELLANVEKYKLTEDQVKALIIYNVFTYCVNNLQEPEMMYMAEIAVAELKKAGYEQPVSNMFINSLFNFRNVYRPVYDLLDYSRNERFDDPTRMSEEYRLGIIDSILALRRYERVSGFGFEDPNPRFNMVVKDQLEQDNDFTELK